MTEDQLRAWNIEKRRLARTLPVLYCSECRAFFRSERGVCVSCLNAQYVRPASPEQAKTIEELLTS